jgi:branched-chain amino acid transport system substrate-binding protein
MHGDAIGLDRTVPACPRVASRRLRSSSWRRVLMSAGGALAFCVAAATAVPAEAQNAASPDRHAAIRIGNTMPYTGPAAAYGIIGKTMAAYFDKVNAEGGINGRPIKFISYDDGYNPQRTAEQARRLVEEDQVLLIFASLGTAQNAAIRAYMNEKKVPQLFVASGDSRWDNPAEAPWTMGWQPNYRTEGRIYGQYLLANRPNAKIAVLYQNDDYGKDELQGLKDGLAGKLTILAEANYDPGEAVPLKPKLEKLRASGADVFIDVTTPKFSIEAIRTLAEMGWKPLHILNAVSNSADSVLKPAGLQNSQGILSAYYLKDLDDPSYREDEGTRDYLTFIAGVLPKNAWTASFAVYAYTIAQNLVEVLRQCGDDLSRENVMRQAASIKGLKLPMLLPGIVINTSASDFAPIEQMQMTRFTGDHYERIGTVLSGVDPGAVSEGFKAIFRFGSGSASRQTATRLNLNTVSMVTGTLGSSYEEIGADLATVLDDGDNLRVLPILGRGSVQGVADILYLKGVDIGVVRVDTLDYLEREGYAENIRGQFTYITKLFNEEMHVIAPKSIRAIGDLDGKTVAVGLSSGSTFVTAINVFDRLGIRPHFLYIEQRIALEKLRRGEIDAVIAVEAKPDTSIANFSDANLHFVPIDYSQPLQGDYLPATLTADDYPDLVPKGERVHTIAVASVLAAYNWPATNDRYRRLDNFVDALFTKLPLLQQPPFHPKWRDVSLNATIPGWKRFEPAEAWLTLHPNPAVAQAQASGAIASSADRLAMPVGGVEPEREVLFREFLQWQQKTRQQ